jgi:iron complex transport system permease protein
MWRASTNGAGLIVGLSALLVVLAILSLMIGPSGLSPRAAISGLIDGDGTAGIIVRSIRLPRTLLAILIGATLGLSGAALQGLLRNPLAEPALFGAPQAAAAGASFVIAYGLSGATSFAVPIAGILGALVSIGGLVAIAGRRASLTVTLLAGLAFASFAGAATALILNLAPSPYAALESRSGCSARSKTAAWSMCGSRCRSSPPAGCCCSSTCRPIAHSRWARMPPRRSASTSTAPG